MDTVDLGLPERKASEGMLFDEAMEDARELRSVDGSTLAGRGLSTVNFALSGIGIGGGGLGLPVRRPPMALRSDSPSSSGARGVRARGSGLE